MKFASRGLLSVTNKAHKEKIYILCSNYRMNSESKFVTLLFREESGKITMKLMNIINEFLPNQRRKLDLKNWEENSYSIKT